ncbi:hypothetical protein BIV57_08340 [Mangrovactinospora gilvigrisea]|uniref:RNA polymerase sigma-70 region 2 domain-containing protein n=1 Tax=Mangrovactinospora gilvigrisea TaxID=1428644 RepID=A0A1J7C8S6_9ACTN|nr:sigma-70 family RNA polymerase sigma factor [Mangrovactinospora gilvigrisea]OIV37936.1 hypothetical protein BIV57_08340 [Mangrovactinospora gilvigrisea]
MQDPGEAREFEAHRAHLTAVARRMLGSAAEAEDAVQEAWLRWQRADGATRADDPRAWLTTAVGRIGLDRLRARAVRREAGAEHAEAAADPAPGPEQEALLADSVGQAMLVVLDALGPDERVAFVLHDLFAVPFARIAPVVGRTVPATRMLATRARRRVRDAGAGADVEGTAGTADPERQRRAVEAFLAASRAGDFAALLELLAPDAVASTSLLGLPLRLRGARGVARGAIAIARLAGVPRIPADEPLAAHVHRGGRVTRTLRFTLRGDRIARIEVTRAR